MEDGEHSSPESSIDGDEMAGEGVSDYEKQRLARISENKARLEALGLPHLASSFLRSSSEQKSRAQNLKKRKGMRSRGRGGDEEEEYRPSDDDGAAEDDDKEENSSAGEEEEEDFRISSRSRRKVRLLGYLLMQFYWAEESLTRYVDRFQEEILEVQEMSGPLISAFRCVPSSFHQCLKFSSGGIQVKNRSSLITAKVKRSSIANEDLNESDIFDDEASLNQAIALSLEATIGDSTGTSAWLSQNSTSDIASKDAQKYKGKVHKSPARRKKTRKLVYSLSQDNARVQLTEDEVVAYFLSFDETGKGYVTPRDVKRMASSHDFCWTDTEIRQMIHSFDNDGDGKPMPSHFPTDMRGLSLSFDSLFPDKVQFLTSSIPLNHGIEIAPSFVIAS
ncbi:hypothetical protein KSP40_PGU022069 [Platanthera guangdongensis]|uniref:EF-hand domain-containing protein n=1 Tax=Platanthera guangdongensis TaxID=2320717 RepID=A0ABR2MNE1_9ASPA